MYLDIYITPNTIRINLDIELSYGDAADGWLSFRLRESGACGPDGWRNVRCLPAVQSYRLGRLDLRGASTVGGSHASPHHAAAWHGNRARNPSCCLPIARRQSSRDAAALRGGAFRCGRAHHAAAEYAHQRTRCDLVAAGAARRLGSSARRLAALAHSALQRRSRRTGSVDFSRPTPTSVT